MPHRDVSNQANQGVPLKKAFAIDDLQFPTVIRSRIVTDPSERGSRSASTTSQRRKHSREAAQGERNSPARSRQPAISQYVRPSDDGRKSRKPASAPVQLTA